jgi:hypothetical protein
MKDCNNLSEKSQNTFFVLVGYDLPKFEIQLEMLFALKIKNGKIVEMKQQNLSKHSRFANTSSDFDYEEKDKLYLRFVNHKGFFNYDLRNDTVEKTYSSTFVEPLHRTPTNFE